MYTTLNCLSMHLAWRFGQGIYALIALEMGKRHSKLAPKTLAELKEQTNFTVEELQEWYKEFSSSWPKGALTVDEFKKAYSTFFPLGDASEFAKHVFRVFDQNDDGKLDFREFVCGFSLVLRGRIEDKLKFSFEIYDINGNGYISREEMSEVLSVSQFMQFFLILLAIWKKTNINILIIDKIIFPIIR